MARALLTGMVLVLAACDSINMWFAPNTTCADWQHMAEGKRSTLTEGLIRGSSLFEAVRLAQHAPPVTPEDQLVAMAVSSITKNCDIQRWSPDVRVKDIVRDLYPSTTQRAAV